MNWKLLVELSNAIGPAGFEEPVAEIVKREFSKLTKEIYTDPIGNVIAHIPGKGPRLALDAHMDEVGFIVSHIDENGFIRVLPLGGVDARVFHAQRLIIRGKKNIFGVVGAIPPHLIRDMNESDKPIPIEESFVDTGLPANEVRKMVRIGDVATFASECVDTENAFIGKAFDDRVGIFVMIEAVRSAARKGCDLYLVSAVQEERGLRGATCSAFNVAPEIAIALEGTVCNDLPGVPAHKKLACQGAGPEIRLMDKALLPDRRLVDSIIKIAEKNKIKHQIVAKNVGGTDATAIQLSKGGVRVSAISVPVRYIHGPNGIVKKSDIENTVSLVKAIIENADSLRK